MGKLNNNLFFLDEQLQIVREHEYICLTLNNNRSIRKKGRNGFKNILAIGKKSSFEDENANFKGLYQYLKNRDQKIFGHFSYDLKNKIEILRSSNPNGLTFPDICFFEPEELIEFDGFKISNDWEHRKTAKNIAIQKNMSKSEYINSVKKIIQEIQLGNIYEMNFAIEFFIEDIQLDPINLFIALLGNSAGPYSSFYKLKHNYVLCASPERYLRIKDHEVLSQPIKGTIKRSENSDEDHIQIKTLLNSEKDRSENIMAVDVVRNDLSRTAESGTVKVDDLCSIHSFEKVHHLISNVTSRIGPEYNIIDVIEKSFPMASMTGAPKISAMKYIEAFEKSKRGLYSGSIGYFDMENNSCDFNVVIRSIQYNSEKKYLSFMTGGAITALSDPEKEYEECLAKAQSILKTLESHI
jgi:para-aminobenzoate synthetase component 1